MPHYTKQTVVSGKENWRLEYRRDARTQNSGSLRLIDGFGSVLLDKDYVFKRGGDRDAHVESVLRNALRDYLNRDAASVAQVHLYTYDSPCGFCTDCLKLYPSNYKNIKFKLAFTELYSDKEAAKKRLGSLQAYRWIVRRFDGRLRKAKDQPYKADSDRYKTYAEWEQDFLRDV
jgi:hypothetical protein